MRVAFLHVGPDLRLPTLMARSARAFGYSLVQMTDDETPAVDGVDEVLRLSWDKTRLMTYRLRHLAQLDDTPTCIVDTDILFRKDVSDVWNYDFDIALTRREREIDVNGFDIATVMPYNTGVMFCRNQDFWKDAHDVCRSLPAKHQDWWGDQLSVKQVAGDYRLLELPVAEWNYAPSHADDAPAQARVLHYKGKVRKDWMR
jgi:hypothetical protein